MLKKLKSVLKRALKSRGSLLVLALKSVAFALLLYLAIDSWFFLLIFALTAFYLYFRPLFNSRQLLWSFLILFLISVLVLKNEFLTQNPWFLVLIIILSILFGLILGIKNLVFIKREPLYYILNGLLFLITFILFFISEKSELFFFKYLFTGLAAFLLSREFLIFNLGESLESFKLMTPSRRNLTALAFGFLMLQATWTIAVLPLGFLNSASLALLIALILEDFFIEHWSGAMNRKIILRNITLFLVLGLVILGASRWSP